MNALTTMVSGGWMKSADGADLERAINALCLLVSRDAMSERTLNDILELLARDIAERAAASLQGGA